MGTSGQIDGGKHFVQLIEAGDVDGAMDWAATRGKEARGNEAEHSLWWDRYAMMLSVHLHLGRGGTINRIEPEKDPISEIVRGGRSWEPDLETMARDEGWLVWAMEKAQTFSEHALDQGRIGTAILCARRALWAGEKLNDKDRIVKIKERMETLDTLAHSTQAIHEAARSQRPGASEDVKPGLRAQRQGDTPGPQNTAAKHAARLGTAAEAGPGTEAEMPGKRETGIGA